VSDLLNYIILGIPFGCVFALLAVGLVLTYKTSGVFNLAFGAQAFGAPFGVGPLYNGVSAVSPWAQVPVDRTGMNPIALS